MSVHRPSVATETAREYSLVIDLQVARQTIDEHERTIDQLRRDATAQYDGARKLHSVIADLRAQLRQAEADKMRLVAENARLSFAFDAATWVVADLRKQLGHDVDERFDRSEVEALGRSTLQ